MPTRSTPVADAARRPWRQRADWSGLLVVVVGGLLLGGVTSPAQSWLPDAFSSVANSPSGWTIAVAALVYTTRQKAWPVAAVYGIAVFEACNLGYQLVSTARGFFYTGEFWAIVALVAGPVVGVAAAWLHRRDLLGAIGIAVLAAIGLGDGIIGILFIPTTSPVYWTLVCCLALALVTTMCVCRLRTSATRAVAILGAAVGSALYCLAMLVVF